MENIEFVSFEDCVNISVGSEDEVIEKIDSQNENSEGMWSHRPDRVDSEFLDFEEYEEDASTGSEELIEAVHVARRFFV